MSERDMAELLALVERHLGASWTDIIEWLRENNSLDDITSRLAAHDIEGVVAEIDTAAQHFAAAVHAGYIEAGQQEAAWLGGEADTLVRFDVENTRAVQWAQRNKLEYLRDLTQDQRDTIRAAIADGLSRGQNPRETAKDIRESIGLTPDQADAVNSYRRALEAQDYSNALDRALSDGRSDQTIRAAQRRGIALTDEQKNLAVERYRQNAIMARAEMIARTASSEAVHAGQEELFRQAIERGDVNAEDLAGEWLPGPNTKNARPDHRTDELKAQRPRMGQPFVLGDGTLMLHPGDPAGGAKHNAGCRCTRAVRYVS